MGVSLTPIVLKQDLALEDLREKRVAVDANGELYQFLALIRLRDGTPLKDSRGRITSHLSGLFYRTTRLVADYRMELVFVFDGKPPALKFDEIRRRRSIKDKYETRVRIRLLLQPVQHVILNPLLIPPFGWVDRHTMQEQSEVQVVPRGETCRAAFADDLFFLHHLSRFNINLTHVAVKCE
ncbi:MAG: hypothetical protein DMG17_26955 [Acidobacteria bacterium]|nr:MAG: hypothetical protein DMG17_26955 [Acidobacteriota bacterium]